MHSPRWDTVCRWIRKLLQPRSSKKFQREPGRGDGCAKVPLTRDPSCSMPVTIASRFCTRYGQMSGPRDCGVRRSLRPTMRCGLPEPGAASRLRGLPRVRPTFRAHTAGAGGKEQIYASGILEVRGEIQRVAPPRLREFAAGLDHGRKIAHCALGRDVSGMNASRPEPMKSRRRSF
jgi:hypothetical protein